MTFALTTLTAFLMTMPVAETTPQSLCQVGEETIISGAVQDDFGLDIAVCVASSEPGTEETPAQRLTIRWEGEGGDDMISCLASECDRVIEYSRYTSPHLTVLQLAWTRNGSVQRLYQTLSREVVGETPRAMTTHSWETASATAGQADSYPVLTNATSMALMDLEAFLTPKPAHMPLLDGAPKVTAQP